MKLLNKIKSLFKSNKIKIDNSVKEVPIYSLGSPDPTCFIKTICDTVSGVDTIVTLNGQLIGFCHGVSYRRNKEGLYGNLILLRFYGNTQFEELFTGKCFGQKYNLHIESEDKYGRTLVILDNESIKFTECAFGVSIDDIVTEYHFAFESFKE